MGQRLYDRFWSGHSRRVHKQILERLNAEIKRRTNVVNIFPNDVSITRLVVAMMLEQNDESELALHAA